MYNVYVIGIDPTYYTIFEIVFEKVYFIQRLSKGINVIQNITCILLCHVISCVYIYNRYIQHVGIQKKKKETKPIQKRIIYIRIRVRVKAINGYIVYMFIICNV